MASTEQVMQTTKTASCVCGAVKIVLSGNPLRTTICHCFACQQRTGSAFGFNCRFNNSQIVSETGATTSFTRIGDSGGHIEYKFCPTCGSTVSYRLRYVQSFISYLIDVLVIYLHDVIMYLLVVSTSLS